MKGLLTFIKNNKMVLSGMVIGWILGFFHWYYFAYAWGSYALSSEMWVNCVFGAIFIGFVFSLLDKNPPRRAKE